MNLAGSNSSLKPQSQTHGTSRVVTSDVTGLSSTAGGGNGQPMAIPTTSKYPSFFQGSDQSCHHRSIRSSRADYSHHDDVMTMDWQWIEVVDEAVAEVLRQKTQAQRIAIGFGLWRSAQRMLRAHLASKHPDWDEADVSREVARRLSHGAA